jgi:hypothetical protein
VSSKAVLSHNEKKNSSISVAYAVGMKETYDSIPNMPNVIKYWVGAYVHAAFVLGDIFQQELHVGYV